MTGGGQGRPLRFLVALVVGWVGVRAAMLWPRLDPVPALVRAVVPVATAEPRALAPARPTAAPPVRKIRAIYAAYVERVRLGKIASAAAIAAALEKDVPLPDAAPAASPPRSILPGLPTKPPQPAARYPSRWSGSAWLVARGGSGIAPGVVGGQLGGSQAGVRLAYTIDRKYRVALATRVTTPLGPGLREAAVGLEWQPTRLPVRIVAEQRIALGAGTGGPALGVVGGFGPVGIASFRLEGYGQAGVIRRDRTEPYVDGAVRATHPLATLGQVRIAAGAGIWGAAQRGASRLDIGPALTLDLPLARQPVRVSLEYRARVAGYAYPGSGVALTLGTDF